MRRLDACPLCRAALTGAESVCPDCQADLTPFTDLDVLARRYLEQARELLSRGDNSRARLIIEQLPQISSAVADEIGELRARLALLEGDYTTVRQLLGTCDPVVAQELQVELHAGEHRQFQGRELHNQALAAARRGAVQQAAAQLDRAVQAAPEEPQLWALKLKVDLKSGYFRRCYQDLANLDRLSARPPEFINLEQLLPPVTGV